MEETVVSMKASSTKERDYWVPSAFGKVDISKIRGSTPFRSLKAGVFLKMRSWINTTK